jgi:hypothetical protein
MDRLKNLIKGLAIVIGMFLVLAVSSASSAKVGF